MTPSTSPPLLARTRALLLSRNFEVYDRPGELNVVAVRTPQPAAPGAFADELHVFYATDAGPHTYAVLPCCTDVPTWLGYGYRPEGDEYPLILPEGQYVNVLELERPPATGLCQRAAMPVDYLRDFNRAAPLGLTLAQPVTLAVRGHAHRSSDIRFVLATHEALAKAAYCPSAFGSTGPFYATHTWQLLRAPGDLQWLLEAARHHVARYGPLTYTVLCERTRRAARLRRAGQGALKAARLATEILAPLLLPPSGAGRPKGWGHGAA